MNFSRFQPSNQRGQHKETTSEGISFYMNIIASPLKNYSDLENQCQHWCCSSDPVSYNDSSCWFSLNLTIHRKSVDGISQRLDMRKQKSKWCVACYLLGMCYGKTWWSSEVWVGSCPDPWPACPAWQQMSLYPSGRIKVLQEISDLQMSQRNAPYETFKLECKTHHESCLFSK